METTDRNNYWRLGYRYARSLSRWIKAGRPVRSEKEILGIFTTYCRECEHLDGSRCGVCGCHVGTVRSPLLNKIAMATERCPLKKWTTAQEENFITTGQEHADLKR